ncbi:MAG: extracellular solute-binding protein [Chloroflexota bacterium]|nr:extracellular solute-binding protein [Chloroflexota bacterium]
MRTRFPILLSLLLALGMVLAACVVPAAPVAPAEPAPAEPAAAEPEPAAPEGENIVFAALTGVEIEGIKAVIPEWEAQTGNTVEVVELPYASLQEKVFTDVQAGAGSYDVIFIDDPWFPFLAGNGYLTPLSEFGYEVDSDFVQRSLDVSTWPPPFGPLTPGTDPAAEGEIYALPSLGNVQLFWYRNDIITEEPETIDELIAVLNEQADPDNGLYGYVHRASRGNPVVTNFNAWNWSFGGDIFDDEWNVVVNGPKSVAALQTLIDLLPLAPLGAANFNADEVGASMLNGSSLAAIVWPAFNVQIDDPTKSAVSGQIAVIPFPKGEIQTSQIGNWLLAIPTASQYKEAAFDFIKFATGADVMKSAALAGAPPTRKSVFEDPELMEKFWWYPAHQQALANATWRPRTPEWNQVEDVLGTYLSKAITGEMDAQSALDQAAEEITAVMERAGYYE